MIGFWLRNVSLLGAVVIMLAGCAETEFLIHTAKRVNRSTETPPAEGVYKVGKPYQIEGVWYYPAEDFEYDETGIASWYGAAFHGKQTANGDVYDMNALTAAHRTLPLPSFVRVTNLENGRSLVLKVNDRGPYARGRIIDISRRGAQLLGYQGQGTARVRVQILADQSRAVAARLQNRDELARVGSPITVDKLPKASVSSESLPAPGGAEASSKVTAQGNVQGSTLPPLQRNTGTISPVGTIPNTTVQSETVALTANPEAAVGHESVKPTSIYVQAGAFGLFDNANKVRARLSPLGSVFLDQVMVNGKDLYRVRVGPLTDVNQADTMLSQVIQTGYPEARIIVD